MFLSAMLVGMVLATTRDSLEAMSKEELIAKIKVLEQSKALQVLMAVFIKN